MLEHLKIVEFGWNIQGTSLSSSKLEIRDTFIFVYKNFRFTPMRNIGQVHETCMDKNV